MVAIDLVTIRAFIIPMQDTLAESLIRSLEKLQGICGILTTLIVDETKSYQVLMR